MRDGRGASRRRGKRRHRRPPPGVGRTRLAHEVLRLAAGRGHPTRWAAGTAASALVPLGSLAHLIPRVDAAWHPLELLQRAVDAIAGAGGEGRPVLAVDDVHFLDPLSVSLVHQLAASGTVSLVLTLRTAFSTPDPVTPLWKDGVATRLDLQPLPRHDADKVVQKVLGGEVETRTSERLWQLSLGNPLFLNELLTDGHRSGHLQERSGLWRWVGRMEPSQRLSEMALAHLGDLSEPERQVLEVLAAVDPLPIELVSDLSDPGAVAALVRRGLVVERSAPNALLMQIAHPLYSEVIRQKTSDLTLRELRRRLVALRPSLATRDAALSRSAILLGGRPGAEDPEMLTEAARRANALLDHALAERLARASILAGAGTEAHLALAEAAQWRGESALSEEVAAAVVPTAASESQLVELTVVRAVTLFLGLDRAAEAFSLLNDAIRSVRDDEDWALLTASVAYLAFLGGDPRRGADTAAAALERAGPAGVARALASAASASAQAVAGRTGAAREMARTARKVWADVPVCREAAMVRVAVSQAEMLALRYGGDIRELERRAEALHEENLASPEWAGDAVASFHRGFAALAAGRPSVASRWYVEALAGLDDRDPIGLLPVCAAELATARAQLGDVDGARELVQVARGTARQVLPAFRPTGRLADAWLAAAESRRDEASRRAVEAAAMAEASGQGALEAIMLHAAACWGDAAEVLSRLSTLANELDSPLVGVCAAHVQALLTGDGPQLDAVVKRFEDMGALLMASQAAGHAALAHESSGDRNAATASRAMVVELARRCGLPGTADPAPGAPMGLTSREWEIARHAARGVSNQEIAASLFLSVRTVETHLAHAYAKLGIRGRRELAGLVETGENRGPT